MVLVWEEFREGGHDLLSGTLQGEFLGWIEVDGEEGQTWWHAEVVHCVLPNDLEEAKAVVEAMVRLEG